MGIHLGRVEGCFWSHHYGRTTDAEWDTFIHGMRDFYDWLQKNGQSGVAATFAWDAEAPNASRRKQIAETIALGHTMGLVIPHALVTNSRAVQMVATALAWLVKKPFPEQAFRDPYAALDWLNDQVPFDRNALVQAVLREVPPDECDASLQVVQRRTALR